ncbi:hypothetical protein NG99_04930 [Erwinia typographi]|uniref:OmpR/PhoB-type domain-containing protein n=1 Tax=Erwinia typographi TaxID=371042 RepID=A0A0A3ZBM5_9GAMM|nr:winged helix-turn-helix domain-containing protein [Erwinia typographi]KGT94991.1 hypothetical protein NG99_04930 [Erwinia typographi]
MRYLLDNTLLFDDKAGSLSVVASGESARLPYSAVLILRVFCENPGELISRNDLMDRAWTENGLRASGSNLYNSLSLIRKTIDGLGIEQQFVRTQPKIGLIMEVSVSPLDDPEQKPEATSPAPVATVPSVSEQQGDVPAAEAIPDDTESPQPGRSPRSQQPFRVGRALSNFYIIWTLFIAVLMFSVSIFKNDLFTSRDDVHVSEYSKVGSQFGCSLFIHNDSSGIYPSSSVNTEIARLAKQYDVDCNRFDVNFYIRILSNAHNAHHTPQQINMICLFNREKDTAIECLNDFSRTQESKNAQ